jgi:hypothetical protein
MKPKFVLNAISLMFILSGAVLKATHSPGASIAIVLGVFVMLFALLVYAPQEMKAQGLSVAQQMLPIAMAVLLIVGALFRIQHWPGANVLVTLGTAATVLFAFSMVRKSKSINLSQQWATTIVLFLVLLGGVLPNNAWALVLGNMFQ